jgi:tRNA(fMet)-specific endonuclease VapC
MIVIDSDVLIEILEKKSQRGSQAFKLIVESSEDLAITVITLHEVMYGLGKHGKSAKDLLSLPVLGYTKKDAVLSSRIELETEKEGNPIERTDAMIAAITMNNEAKLYTFNQKHFKHIKDLGLKLFTEQH